MSEKMWNVAAYARLSRDDGDKAESDSIGSQREIIRSFVREHGDMVIVEEYADDGYSGVNFDRPDFQRMMEDVKAKKVDCIICKDLSRFARNYIDAGRYLEKIFPFMGVRFIAITDNYDSSGTKSQSDALIVPFKNLINDAYCKDISTKIRSQLDVKRKMGEFIGAFATYGYRKDPENKNRLLVDEDAARVVELIFDFRLKGMSNAGIADKLNDMGILSPTEYKRSKGMRYDTCFRTNEKAAWSAVTVKRILTDETYLGTLIQHRRGTPNYKVKKLVAYDRADWIVAENNHDAIIEETDFQTVQMLLQRDVRVAPGSKAVHLLAGFVFCGDCGQCMTRRAVTSNGKRYYYLVCSTHKAGQGCSSHSFSEQKLVQIVFSHLQKQIKLVAEVADILSYIRTLPESSRAVINYDAQIAKVEAEIERYKSLKMHLYGDMADGIVSKEEYMEFRAGYDRKIASCQLSLGRIQEERRQAVDDGGEHSEWMEKFLEYGNITELDRGAVVNLIERIVVYDATHIEITFRYDDKLESAMQYIGRFKDVLPGIAKEA